MHVIQVQLLDQGLIKKKDFESLILVDDMDEVVEIIQGRQLEVLDSSNP